MRVKIILIAQEELYRIDHIFQSENARREGPGDQV
jgi:hypothetical protein